MDNLNEPLPIVEIPLYKKWYFWILVILVIMVAVNLVSQNLAQRGWSKDFKCVSWMPYSQQDYDSGKKCSLVSNCAKIEDENRIVEKCSCNYLETNRTFDLKRICVQGYEIKNYKWNNEFFDEDLNKTIKFGN